MVEFYKKNVFGPSVSKVRHMGFRMELCPLDLSVAQTILTLSTLFFYFYWADVETFLKIRTKYKPGSTIVPANSFQKWQF